MLTAPASLLLTAALLSPLTAATGPGLANSDFAAQGRSVFDMVARFDPKTGTPAGQGYVTMHNGYLLVPFSNDGGGGDGTGGFAYYDVSDPSQVTLKFTTADQAHYNTEGSDQYAGNLREPHGFSVWGDIFCFTSNDKFITGDHKSNRKKYAKNKAKLKEALKKGGENGLQFWDFSDMESPTGPKKISSIMLPGLQGGDYDSTAWWTFWQGGRYAYVAGTNGGLYIVDASDPANPVMADRGGEPNPVPITQLGNFRINTVFAIGNLLVIAASDKPGMSTVDISDPLHPSLLATVKQEVGYSMMVNGHKILGAHSPAVIYDISDPENITTIGQGAVPEGTKVGPKGAKGGYGTVKDGFFHYGSSHWYGQLDLSNLEMPRHHAAKGFSKPDWDFAVPLGNMTFMGNDHSGSALVISELAPDTTGPAVNMVSPVNGAVHQALTSRIGLTFTDQILTESISPTAIIVRPVGGQALAGRYSNQTGIVNFWPDEPLQADTTYEVVVPAGELKDFAGNPVSTAFTSRFATGATVGP